MHTTPTKAHIQLVEDDPIVSATLLDGLSSAGYQVTANSDADSALSVYRRQPPDLVIVDIGLPDKPGTVLAADMLQYRYRPILILSSHSDGSRIKEAIDSGVIGYLVKPLSAKQLIPSIETALARFADISAEMVARLDRPAHTDFTLDAVLEQFSFAVAIVAKQGRILYENSRARQVLAEHPLLHQQNGLLRARRQHSDLMALLQRVLSSHPAAEVLTLQDGIHSLNIFASVLDNSDAAIILMNDPQQTTVAPARVLRTLYSLTTKESQLAESLLNGHTLEEYCADKHVSLNTVRSQLKSIYRKTDTSRQAELIRLLSRLFDNVNTQIIA